MYYTSQRQLIAFNGLQPLAQACIDRFTHHFMGKMHLLLWGVSKVSAKISYIQSHIWLRADPAAPLCFQINKCGKFSFTVGDGRVRQENQKESLSNFSLWKSSSDPLWCLGSCQSLWMEARHAGCVPGLLKQLLNADQRSCRCSLKAEMVAPSSSSSGLTRSAASSRKTANFFTTETAAPHILRRAALILFQTLKIVTTFSSRSWVEWAENTS